MEALAVVLPTCVLCAHDDIFWLGHIIKGGAEGCLDGPRCYGHSCLADQLNNA